MCLSSEHATVPLVVSMLSINKGKKLLPRIMRHLSADQNLTLVTVILAHFGQLQVCHNVIYPGTTVANADEARKQKFVAYDEVELFMNMAAPPLLAFITEAPLQVVNGLLKVFMEKNDVKAVARTKVREKKGESQGRLCQETTDRCFLVAWSRVFDYALVAC